MTIWPDNGSQLLGNARCTVCQKSITHNSRGIRFNDSPYVCYGCLKIAAQMIEGNGKHKK